MFLRTTGICWETLKRIWMMARKNKKGWSPKWLTCFTTRLSTSLLMLTREPLNAIITNWRASTILIRTPVTRKQQISSRSLVKPTKFSATMISASFTTRKDAMDCKDKMMTKHPNSTPSSCSPFCLGRINSMISLGNWQAPLPVEWVIPRRFLSRLLDKFNSVVWVDWHSNWSTVSKAMSMSRSLVDLLMNLWPSGWPKVKT
mmetsp:Transcript_35168/g.73239  ORF Transcript_35168/g.73239 Transcript_35168/m.73239 type:complete len:202 (-) Transcript_35168:1752-2357(-)